MLHAPWNRLARAWGVSPLVAAMRAAGIEPPTNPDGPRDDDLDFDHPAPAGRGLSPEECRDRRIGWVAGPGAGRVAVTVFDVAGAEVGRVFRRVETGGGRPTTAPRWATSRGFPAGRHLYNLDRAWPAAMGTGTAVVVEGPFDAIHLERHGWANAVALLGNRLTGWHVDLLLTVGVGTVVLLLDNDHGGRLGTRWARHGDGRLDQFRVVDLHRALPRGRDPDDLGGPELAAILGPFHPGNIGENPGPGPARKSPE